jgi:hypothetical protein
MAEAFLTLSADDRREALAIVYKAAASGNLQLAPGGEARAALATDYVPMVEDGLLIEDAEPFEALIERCTDIAERANRAAG